MSEHPDEAPLQAPLQAPLEARPQPVQVRDWQRLNPLMLLVHPINEIFRFLPLVIGSFFFGASTPGGGPWQWIGVGIPIALGLARFVTTKYRITPTQIELHRGLLARRVLTAPLDRVRTIELTSSPIHRVLGLAKVQIGTGGVARPGEEKLELDALAGPDARLLRTALLRRSDAAQEEPGAATGDVLLTFDPAWARYAPLTSSGLVIAAGLLAVVSQITNGFSLDLDATTLPEAGSVPLVLLVAVLVAGPLFLLAALSIAGYLVTNWGFRLSTDAGRSSFRVVRGLVTTRETSLEAARIRGLEVHEPFGLRLAGAARLNAAVTGLERQSGGVSPLAPVAPRAVVDAVASNVVLGREALTGPLVQHGPRARRRRTVRALLGTLPFALVPVAGVLLVDWSPWSLVAVPLLLALAELLARDRYARLGHALTGSHLVVRSGTFRSRRDILERTGVIGWNLRQSWFQRRAGLVDLVATTSAGKQAYTAYDVPEHVAVALAEKAVPGLLEQFRPDRVRSAS